MASRVLNLTRNSYVKAHQAEERIAAGVAVWIERRVSFRELTLPEVLERRSLKEQHGVSGLTSPYRGMSNELPGLKWEPPTADKYKFRQRFPLLRAAAEFMRQAEFA